MTYYGTPEHILIDKQAFELIYEHDGSDNGYDWSTVGLLRDLTSGQLYYVQDGGCSCNSFLDYVTMKNLEPVANWAEAVECVKRDEPYHFNEVDIFRFAEELNKLRPAPSPALGV